MHQFFYKDVIKSLISKKITNSNSAILAKPSIRLMNAMYLSLKKNLTIENMEKHQFNYLVLTLLMLMLLHQEHLYKHQDIKVVMPIHNSFTLGIRAWD